MEQLFVTADGQLLDRWSKAFPGAIAVATIDEVAAASSAPRGVLWLDTRNVEPDQLAKDLQEAVSFGWPVVVMAAVESTQLLALLTMTLTASPLAKLVVV